MPDYRYIIEEFAGNTGFDDNRTSETVGTLTIGGATLNVTTGHGDRFADPGTDERFILTLGSFDDYEQIECSDRTADAISILARGVGGTTAQEWPEGTPVYNGPAALVFNNYLQASANFSDVPDKPQARGNLGLGNVNNTSDADKPISTAQQTALNAKQAHSADLDTIAAMDSSQVRAIASDGTGWLSKTASQFKTWLGLTKSDVGLGNVDNEAVLLLNSELFMGGALMTVAAASNITLSGLQDIDGVTGEEGLQVICVGQTDLSENLMYSMTAGDWTGYTLADYGALATTWEGICIKVTGGDTYAGHIFAQTERGAEDGDDLRWLDLNDPASGHVPLAAPMVGKFFEAFMAWTNFPFIQADQFISETGSFGSSGGDVLISTGTTPYNLTLGQTTHGAILGGPLARAVRVVNNSGTIIGPTDDTILHTGLTGAKTDTLPAASSHAPGTRFSVVDFDLSASVAKTITLQRSGSDTIEGGTSLVAINSAGGRCEVVTDGVSKYKRCD